MRTELERYIMKPEEIKKRAAALGLNRHDVLKLGKRAKGAKPGPITTPALEPEQKLTKDTPLPKEGRGAGKLTERLSPAELEKEVQGLLKELKASTDGEDKKRIRRLLRARGHKGGLGERPLPKA
jgi:hypothetical protein